MLPAPGAGYAIATRRSWHRRTFHVPHEGISLGKRRVLTPALMGALAFLCSAASAEPVTFNGHGISLHGELLKPEGAGPFPAIVALHGCAGLYGRNGELSARHAEWAKRLVERGYVVLFPDSFGSRGAGPQCKVEDRVTRPAKERRDDAFASKAYLQTRQDVNAQAISLLAWSNGGSTVLYTVGEKRPAWDEGPDFAKAVAFYPGCRLPLAHGDWHARIPLLILVGSADDWTPAKPCEDLANQARANGEPVSIVVYPGAYHDFDHPHLRVHETDDLAFTADGGGSAHTGTDPAARADVLERVPAFLAQ